MLPRRHRPQLKVASTQKYLAIRRSRLPAALRANDASARAAAPPPVPFGPTLTLANRRRRSLAEHGLYAQVKCLIPCVPLELVSVSQPIPYVVICCMGAIRLSAEITVESAVGLCMFVRCGPGHSVNQILLERTDHV